MSKVSRNSIEIIFNNVQENFNQLDYSNKIEILISMEEKAKIYDGKNISEIQAIKIAFEKIKYHFSRIYGEGKAKSTLVNLKKSIDFLEFKYGHINNFKEGEKEREIDVIKDLITYLEISLNLDITFYTSLINIYQACLEKENLSFNQVRIFSESRRNR